MRRFEDLRFEGAIYDPACGSGLPPGTMIEAGLEASGGKKDFDWFIFDPGYRGPVGWPRRDPQPQEGEREWK